MATRPVLRWKTYALLERAVEEGARYGWHRAHKHLDDPTEAYVIEQVVEGVMNALAEIVQFDAED